MIRVFGSLGVRVCRVMPAVMAALTLALALALGAPAWAQDSSSSSNFMIGSGNTATADPPVPHPHEKPCVVQLFSNLEFADFNIKLFDYTPPENCPGPWAKVVLVMDFNETTGVQFDRTAQVSIGFVNVYYGTTPEPTPTLGPTWHAERDVTDCSALLKHPQTGEANLGNLIEPGLTGIIFGNAKIEFYPANFFNPAPRTADEVLPIPDASGGAVIVPSTTSPLTQTFTLPTNIEQVYLDVFAQSQQNDEFWYTCVPNDLANELQSCGNTAFRETEISIDGQPAGVAPVYPWIFTGGIDPFLWAPIPGVQTLNFVPYRVDLTPFAGMLSNGEPHTVTIGVFNADNYFLVTGTLLLFEDHGSKKVTGEVTTNTIGAAPNPDVAENLATAANGDVTGTVTVTSARKLTLEGFVKTSHGRVDTKVEQQVNFSNAQQFNITSSDFVQNITQDTTVSSKTTTRDGFLELEVERHYAYPLTVDISEPFNPDGSLSIITSIEQTFESDETDALDGFPIFLSHVSNTVSPSDTLLLNASFQLIGNQDQKSSQQFTSFDTIHGCFSRTLTAANNVLTDVKNGQDCK
jgi:Peptide N-acetyl-beta-D-glucosaminyl asparaginase amidase A